MQRPEHCRKAAEASSEDTSGVPGTRHGLRGFDVTSASPRTRFDTVTNTRTPERSADTRPLPSRFQAGSGGWQLPHEGGPKPGRPRPVRRRVGSRTQHRPHRLSVRDSSVGLEAYLLEMVSCPRERAGATCWGGGSVRAERAREPHSGSARTARTGWRRGVLAAALAPQPAPGRRHRGGKQCGV